MSDLRPLDLLRALLDPTRLAVAGAAVAGTVSIDELAERLDVPPKVIARAIGDLRAVGLLDVSAGLDTDSLRSVATSLPASGGTGEPVMGPWTDEEAAILGRFFDGDRLIEIPSARAKRHLVLEKVALSFEPGRRYPERDVNFLIQLIHPDYVTLRRYLIDAGLLDRADGAYWRIGGRLDLEVPDASERDDADRDRLPTSIDGVELRAYRSTMLRDLVVAANDPRIPRFMGDEFPHPYTEEAGEAWMDIATAASPPTQYAIFVDGVLSGGVGGFPGRGENTGSVEIGWWLRPDHWGRGITTAAATVIVDEFFAERGAMRVFAPVMAPNHASSRVAEKAGLRLEGVERGAYLKAGVRYDKKLYGLTRREWSAGG